MNKRDDFVKLLGDLCYIYKDYVINNDGKLDVIIENNMIKMYLYNKQELLDEFGLVFSNKEKDKYYYVSLVLMKELYGGKIVYNKDNVFYEEIDGSGFRIVVNDRDLFDRMFMMMGIYRNIDFYEKIDVNRKVRNKVNRDCKKIKLNERVNITKKLVRTRW